MSTSSRNGGPKSQERGRSESPFGVVATAHFESGPPNSKFKPSDEDGEVIETVREEEWEERRKKTTTTTKNVERRIQRQLVLEDGAVIDDTGPVITEDTTTDKVTHEVVSDQNQRPEGQLAIEPPEEEGWIATPGAVIISEKCTKTVKSHDEVEDEVETEEVQHCGDVTNQEAEEHLRGQTDLRELISQRQSQGKALALHQKKVVHEATRRRGNVDTVDVRESSKIKDGHVVTETERTVTKEQYDNESAPDSGSSISDGSVHEETKATSHNLVHTKDEDLLEYYAVPKGAPLAQGVKIGEGMHVVSEDVHEDRQGNENDEADAADRLKKVRKPGRRDALTKKLLNYDQEEETRKSETNKWLEHHFGSESGRSEDSFHEDIHSSGGNRITITMSPHPASNEDVPDSSSPARHWSKESKMSPTKGPPPPPPPKPDRMWSTRASSPPMSPTSPTSQSSFQQAHDIQGTELAAARSRLRSTGLNLTEENKENNAPESPVKSFDSARLKTSESLQQSPTYATPSVNKYSSLKNDVIYSSKFRSGHPKKGYAPPAPDYHDAPPSITNVGRSQSFHVQTLPWSSLKKDTTTSYRSTMKDYRSEERLDDIDTRKNYRDDPSYGRSLKTDSSSYSYKPNYSEEKSRKIKSSWSPPREPTPPPPPRQSRKNQVIKSHSSFEDNYGREAATQTGPSPVPPPRTKRKKKPKSSYFFGQENGVSSYAGTSSLHNGLSNRHLTQEPYYSNNYSNESRYNNESSSPRRSPKTEKRYKTTKTITPVLVIPYEERSDKYRNRDYSSQNLSKSSWTNTVDPRRRPRVTDEEERSTTLPRKFYGNTSLSSTKKTYLFGEDNNNTRESKYIPKFSSTHIGSMNNVHTNQFESDNDHNRFSSLNTKLNSKVNKSVGRSQSFNVQAGKSNPYSLSNGRTFSEIRDQKSSNVYGSTPYVNLRSPNLIANIARTSSTRIADLNDSNEYGNKNDEEYNSNREKFMKGLLDNAPELYHFMHGGENGNDSPKRTIIIKPSVDTPMPYSPPSAKSPSYSARVFTFGKSDSNTLTRTPSQGAADHENKGNSYNNTYSSDYRTFTTEENNKRNSILSNPNRKSTFNLKTSGSSLLYSPSFRSQQQEAEERRKREKEKLSGDFSNENQVLIQVRDWNMR